MSKIKAEAMNRIAAAIGVRPLPDDEKANYPAYIHRVNFTEAGLRIYTSDAITTWISHGESLEETPKPSDLWVAARPFNRLFSFAGGGMREVDQDGPDLRVTYCGSCIVAGRTRPGESCVNIDESVFKSYGVVSPTKLEAALEWLCAYVNPGDIRPELQVLTLATDGKGYASTGTVCVKAEGLDLPFPISLTAPAARVVSKWLRIRQPEKLEVKRDDGNRLMLKPRGSDDYLVVAMDDRVAPPDAFTACEGEEIEEVLVADCESLKSACARVITCSDTPHGPLRLSISGKITPQTANMAAKATMVVSTPMGYHGRNTAEKRSTAEFEIVRVHKEDRIDFEVSGDSLVETVRRIVSMTVSLTLLKKRGFLLIQSELPGAGEDQPSFVRQHCLLCAKYLSDQKGAG